jgi:L-2,4-diaminobutyrate decarboxylase
MENTSDMTKDKPNRYPVWSTDVFRRLGVDVLELLAEFVESSRNADYDVVSVRSVEDVAASMNLAGVVTPNGVGEERMRDLIQHFLAGATRLHHPAYVAHQVALPHGASALADLVSGTLNNGMSIYEMGPTGSAVEIEIVDWMLAKVGWQPTGRHRDRLPGEGKTAGGGVLTHGGSLANLTALLAARAAVAPESWQSGSPDDLVVLAPPNAHYSLSRATAVLGLGTDALLDAPVDELGRIVPDRLPHTVDMIEGRGKRIMAVCANSCATATGLFDSLHEIGSFCRERGLWLHIDGAHGASALLHPTEAQKLAGVELGDSLSWDAHKLMQTSVLCAAALFRDGRTLARAFQQDATYVIEGQREVGFDVIAHQFECTKTPLGLKLLLTLAAVGEQGMADNIDALWSIARLARRRISERSSFEVLCPPESNILCFRHIGDDALQTWLREQLMRRGDFLLSQADVGDRRWLRLTIMNPLTDIQTIDRMLDTIEDLVREQLGS